MYNEDGIISGISLNLLMKTNEVNKRKKEVNKCNPFVFYEENQ